jgi:cell division protein ZipA
MRAPRRPPLIEISDDFEVDISAYMGGNRRRLPVPEPIDTSAADTERKSADEDADHRAPWVRTQPMERSEVAPKRAPKPDEPKAVDLIEQHAVAASKQRIVALRLVAHQEHWDEGMSYGRYSIFHREREDGKTLFYVASMMEPGSFDLASMDGQLFPGISLFGIVPGPLDAPATFDLVLAAARHLAERLKGQLQDEQGSTLTAQRILNLREELVHFEHRNKRLRRN